MIRPLCMNCKHSIQMGDMTYRCKHAEASMVDCVTGQAPCEKMRATNGPCGAQAVLFEARK